jgi:hypothetical protein
MESKRTLGVLERSLSGFWHNGCHTNTSRKLHINFKISICLGSAPSPMCLHNIIMESKRTLEVPDRSLDDFFDREGGSRDYPKTTWVIFNGVIYYWQAYELGKARALESVSQSVSQITACRACFAAKNLQPPKML